MGVGWCMGHFMDNVLQWPILPCLFVARVNKYINICKAERKDNLGLILASHYHSHLED